MQVVRFFLVLLVAAGVAPARAFPEMIRMGYVNCTSCHVSPNGGGLMTDYGRSLASEALSTWSYAQEEWPGHGVLPEAPPWLKVGGDVRWIQTYVDNAQATAATAFLMQGDLELGLNFGKFWYVQSLGVQGGPNGAPGKGEFVAHRYYGLYNWSDEGYVRAGKYLLPFGLNIPDHTSFIKRNLGFDQDQETYNLDVGRIGEQWNVLAAVSFGRKDKRAVNLETGGTVVVAYNLGDTHKVMGSFAYLKGDGPHRYLLGPQVLWGFNSRWVFMGEFDYQEKTTEGPTKSVQKGAVTYSRLQYEWLKGLHSYLLHQFSYTDFTQLRTRVNSTGVGMIWYPRPHLEVIAEADYAETAEINSYNTVAWLLAHYYF